MSPFTPIQLGNVADLIWSSADFVNPANLPEGKSIVDHLVEMTDGGLDFTYDATGNVRGTFNLSPPVPMGGPVSFPLRSARPMELYSFAHADTEIRSAS